MSNVRRSYTITYRKKGAIQTTVGLTSLTNDTWKVSRGVFVGVQLTDPAVRPGGAGRH
jgi:hypothetical protein